MLGYHKKILRVDLTNRKVEIQDLEDSLLEKYVGGVGLGARLLYDETTADTDPLGPENILAAMTGPFTDSRVPLRRIERRRLLGRPFQEIRIRRDRRHGEGRRAGLSVDS
jgi:hypothetical protein